MSDDVKLGDMIVSGNSEQRIVGIVYERHDADTYIIDWTNGTRFRYSVERIRELKELTKFMLQKERKAVKHESRHKE